jgi:hypothetical protein
MRYGGISKWTAKLYAMQPSCKMRVNWLMKGLVLFIRDIRWIKLYRGVVVRRIQERDAQGEREAVEEVDTKIHQGVVEASLRLNFTEKSCKVVVAVERGAGVIAETAEQSEYLDLGRNGQMDDIVGVLMGGKSVGRRTIRRKDATSRRTARECTSVSSAGIRRTRALIVN